MKQISDRIQGGNLFARIVGSGEVGILRVKPDNTTDNATYWNTVQEAVSDLKAIIAYFEPEMELVNGKLRDKDELQKVVDGIRAHVEKKTQAIIEYARKTGEDGRPDMATVEQNVEQVLWFIYNMGREATPGESMEDMAKRIKGNKQYCPHCEDSELEELKFSTPTGHTHQCPECATLHAPYGFAQ